jgi:hypothetical protein
MNKVKNLSEILTRDYIMVYQGESIEETNPKKVNITKLEAKMLYRIFGSEGSGVAFGYSEFDRYDGTLTNQDKGVLSSLFKKGLIFEGEVSHGMGYHPQTGEWSSEIIIPTWTSCNSEFDFIRFPEQNF